MFVGALDKWSLVIPYIAPAGCNSSSLSHLINSQACPKMLAPRARNVNPKHCEPEALTEVAEVDNFLNCKQCPAAKPH